MYYYHAFGYTKDVLIYPQNSITFDFAGMIAGHPMIDAFIMNKDMHLQLHVMDINDGTYKTY